MSRVDFYILPDDSRRALHHFACRLAEKAYNQGQKILIQTESADESRALDDLMWTMQDNNFIPHSISNAASNDDQAVIISHNNEAVNDVQLFINLSSMAAQHEFERIAEVLNQQANCKQIGREHYKFYRDSGFELHHHEIKPS
jgi:DNA polymerase III subunit chi